MTEFPAPAPMPVNLSPLPGSQLVPLADFKPAITGAMSIYARIANPLDYCSGEHAKAAEILLKAPAGQGPAILFHCMARGMTLFDMLREYDWIVGKPCPKPAAMLANWASQLSGKHKILSRTDKLASIELTAVNGEVTTHSFSRRDALLSRWPWSSDGGGWKKHVPAVRARLAAGENEDVVWADMSKWFKDNWGTETDWVSMLWSRCIGNAMRSAAPQLYAGFYTPEEMRDVAETIDAGIVAKKPITAEEFLAAQAEQERMTTAPTAEMVVEAEVVSVAAPEPPQPTPQPQATAAPAAPVTNDTPGSATEQQCGALNQYFEACGISPDDRAKALQKRGVNAIRSLSANQAAELLQKLHAMYQTQQAKAQGN